MVVLDLYPRKWSKPTALLQHLIFRYICICFSLNAYSFMFLVHFSPKNIGKRIICWKNKKVWMFVWLEIPKSYKTNSNFSSKDWKIIFQIFLLSNDNILDFIFEKRENILGNWMLTCWTNNSEFFFMFSLMIRQKKYFFHFNYFSSKCFFTGNFIFWWNKQSLMF